MKRFAVLFLLILGLTAGVFAQQKTTVKSASAARLLAGKHKLALQWISWDYFGSAVVKVNKGVYSVKGEQKSRENNDFVTVDGFITSISAKEFTFDGTIITKISHCL